MQLATRKDMKASFMVVSRCLVLKAGEDEGWLRCFNAEARLEKL